MKITNMIKKISLIAFLIICMGTIAFASETISVTFTDPERGAFNTSIVTLEVDDYNRIILPDTFLDTVTVTLPESQKVDDETYYFDADWETNPDAWAYSFTGWHIVGTAKRIVGITTFHVGELIDFEYLAQDENTGDVNKYNLVMEACWGKTVFIRNQYNNMYYNKYVIFDEAKSAASGATGASDSNSGRKPSEPVCSMNQAYSMLDKDVGTDFDATKSVVMLVGDLDYVKSNSTSSNQPGYNSAYNVYYFGYDSQHNTGNYAANRRSATIKSIGTLGHNAMLRLKAYNYHYYPNGSLAFDNVDVVLIKTTEIDNYDSSIMYIGSIFNIQNRDFVLTWGNRCTNSRNTGFSCFANQARYVIINGGYFGAMRLTQGHDGTHPKTIFLIGKNAFVPTLQLGTNNVNFPTSYYQDMEAWINNGKVSTVYGSSDPLNHTTAGTRRIVAKGATITTFYGGGNQGCLYGNIDITIKNCNITNFYGGGNTFTATTYGNVIIDILKSTIGNIYCGGRNGNVEKVPEGAPYGIAGAGGNISFNIVDSKVNGNIFGSGTGGSQTVQESNYRSIGVTNTYWTTSEEWLNPLSDYPAYIPETEYIRTYAYKSIGGQYRSSSVHTYRYKTYAYLSLAMIENIEMNINNTEVTGNVYGGGSIAVVKGNATINVTNGSTVKGFLYGGGDGVTPPQKVDVYYPLSSDGYTPPMFTITEDFGGGLYTTTGASESGACSANKYSGKFTWSKDESLKLTNGIDPDRQLIYSPNTEGLGSVRGSTFVTIDNSTVLKDVYAGGNAGEVFGNTSLNIKNNSVIGGMIYAGGNNGDVDGSSSTVIDGATIRTLYGGGNNGDIKENSTLTINRGTIETAYGGGNLGKVYGDTDVKVGNSTNPVVNITSLLYGGGRGANASFETVLGKANVLIEGYNTHVENYGSVRLGKVVGDVDVTFKDYWTGNITDKYKVMNGIDRATSVYFDNSFVLLENRAQDGTLEGIKDITDIYIPAGSGLKVSADGEIKGDFHGGGNFFLDSEVCITVDGNIYGETLLILNPLLVADMNLIRGTKDYPYMRIKQGDYSAANNAMYSSDPRYTIISGIEDNTGYKIYYIANDVEINEKVENTVFNAEGEHYTDTIDDWTTDDIYLRNDGIFSADISSIINCLVPVGSNDYKNVTRGVSLVSMGTLVNFPKDTILKLYEEGELYSIKLASSMSEVPLTMLENVNNPLLKYIEVKNVIAKARLVTSSDLLGNTYEYSEHFRIIVDFSEVAPENMIAMGPYNFMMNYYDRGLIINDMVNKAKNIVRISEVRNYNVSLTIDEDYFEPDGSVRFNMQISAELDPATDEVYGNPVYAIISIINSDDEAVVIESDVEVNIGGTIVTRNSGTNIKYQVLPSLTQEAFNKVNNVELNFSNAARSSQLSEGRYTLKVEYYVGTDAEMLIEKLAEFTKTFDIKTFDMSGFLATVERNGQTTEGALTLNGSTPSKTVTVIYMGDLVDGYVDINVQKLVSGNTYADTPNVFTVNRIQPVVDTQNITVSKASAGAGQYKIIFTLKDRTGKEKASEALLFKVQ